MKTLIALLILLACAPALAQTDDPTFTAPCSMAGSVLTDQTALVLERSGWRIIRAEPANAVVIAEYNGEKSIACPTLVRIELVGNAVVIQFARPVENTPTNGLVFRPVRSVVSDPLVAAIRNLCH